jgi:hypothetical protein
VDDLLVRIKLGELRIPTFQRELKWDNDDRVALIDSMYRGYPIGTILLWKHPAPAGTVRFGDYIVDAPERSDALWIVDGQQRLVTLATVLGAEQPAKQQMQLVIERDQSVHFEYLQGRLRAPEDRVRVPTHVLLDASDVAEWCIDQKLSIADRRQVLDVAKKLREYQLAAYLVEGDDEQVLREIFNRSNRSGKALTETEVFEAVFGAKTDRVPSLKGVAAALVSQGFGSLPNDIVHQTVRLVAGIDHRDDFVEELRGRDVKAEVARTEAALARAIQFLKHETGFVHIELVPYSTALLLAALVFDRFHELHERSRTLLRRWLWRGALDGRLINQSANVARIARQMKPGDEHGSIQRLFQLFDELPYRSNEPIVQASGRADSARMKMLATMLASLEPRDLQSGERIALKTLLDQGLDTALAVIDPRLPKSDPANRALHPPVRGGLVQLIADASPTARQSQVLEGSWEIDQRRVLLQQLCKDFAQRYAERGADDSAPLSAIIVEE